MAAAGSTAQSGIPRRNDAALASVGLDRLMAAGRGAGVAIGLLDGPVAADHPALAGADVRVLGVQGSPHAAGGHGTFVAGILAAARDSPAPGICPACRLLVRPIFGDASLAAASADEVAAGIHECLGGGARILNLSAATQLPSTRAEHRLQQALDAAARRGVLVVAAAGNRATLGSSVITRHPWVVPVVAYDRRGRPLAESTVGTSIGRRGIGAPGDAIESLAPDGGSRTGGGTSAAAAIVTGALALAWSLVPRASAHRVRAAVPAAGGRRAVVPPLLDAPRVLRTLQGSA